MTRDTLGGASAQIQLQLKIQIRLIIEINFELKSFKCKLNSASDKYLLLSLSIQLHSRTVCWDLSNKSYIRAYMCFSNSSNSQGSLKELPRTHKSVESCEVRMKEWRMYKRGRKWKNESGNPCEVRGAPQRSQGGEVRMKRWEGRSETANKVTRMHQRGRKRKSESDIPCNGQGAPQRTSAFTRWRSEAIMCLHRYVRSPTHHHQDTWCYHLKI